MKQEITHKGKLLLIKLWNKNRKSQDHLVRERAIEMLNAAFDSPEEIIMYFKRNNIEYEK